MCGQDAKEPVKRVEIRASNGSDPHIQCHRALLRHASLTLESNDNTTRTLHLSSDLGQRLMTKICLSSDVGRLHCVARGAAVPQEV